MAERKAVLITGASSGIGEVTARVLAQRGFHVFAGVRRTDDGARVAREIGERCTPVIIDVTDRASIDAAAQALLRAGGIFGLVNNAGIALAGPMEYVPLDDLRRQFEVNVFGTVAVTQAMLPLLRRSVGRIVNVGSIAGRSPFPMMGPYAASKAALEMLSQIGRMELAPFDIDVSYIEPGSHKTPIWERSGQAADEFEARLPQIARDHYGDALRGVRAIAARQARTGGDPADVAAAIATALTATHPAARYTVGNDTRLRRVLGLLPPRVREQLLIRVLERAGHA